MAMTEAEWLACDDPTPMLRFLHGKISDRKARLFAVACCRRIWHLVEDERSRKAVEVLEKFAEGAASREELSAAAQDALDVAESESDGHAGNPYASAAAANATEADLPAGLDRGTALDCISNAVKAAVDAAFAASWATGHSLHEQGSDDAWFADVKAEQADQCRLVRCLVGNPFHLITPDPTWQTPNTVPLARTIYDERRFELLPLLADLLEEAGCPADVGKHCRSAGPHARGCWVVDLVLGRS
jgi:hypothetical protein